MHIINNMGACLGVRGSNPGICPHPTDFLENINIEKEGNISVLTLKLFLNPEFSRAMGNSTFKCLKHKFLS
jgi:hypothetical protein